MKLVYKTSENITVADLDQLAVTYSGVVNIGRKCNIEVPETSMHVEKIFIMKSERIIT